MKSNFVRWIGNRSQRTRLTQTERNRKIRQRSVLEQLEDRRLLAYTFTGGGTNVGTATSDGNADTLYIEPFAGLIYHSTDGIVFSPDWGGGLTIASSSANTINILQGNSANAHAVNLGGTLGPESDLAAQINVNNGGPLDSLVVNDSTDTQSATGANAYTVTASTITGPPTMNVHLTGAALGAGVTLLGGTAANQFNVTSTFSGEPVTLVGGASNDTFFVSGNSDTVNVDGGGGVNTVTVGPSNTVANIHGAVNVGDTGGTTNLNISAFNDTAGTTATDKLNTGTGLAEIIGVTPAGSQVNYAPGVIQTLTVTNNGNAANLFTLDFSNGNVLPAAGPGASLNYNGGNQANPLLVHGELDLIGTLPTGAWGNETHTVTGASSGSIQLDNSLINYTGVPTHTINDVTPAVNYTFVDSSTPGIVDINTGPVFAGFQTLRIMSLDPVPAFVDTNIANKTNVTVNLPLNTGPDASFKLFVSYGSLTPVPGLSTLTVNQANDGDTTISATPPGVPVTVNQTNGEFTTEVTGTGLASGTTTTVNGSAGNGTMLTYDAGGVAAINAANVNTFFFPGVSSTPMTVNTTLVGTSFGAGTLVYNNYKAVTVNNIAPGTQFIIPNALAAVRGTSLTNVDVATFISTAIGAKASDFQASINWGDGSPPYAATVVQDPVNPTHFEVIGSHTYSLTGTITPNPTVSVTSTGSTGMLFVNGVPTTFNTDPSTLTSVANFSVTVADAGLAASANPLSAVEGTATPAGLILGTFLDTGGAQPTTNYTATINWGDGTGTHTLPPSAITQNGTSNTFSIAGAAHLYTEAGTHVFTLTISDSATPAQTVTVTGTASVADAALTPIASPPLTATEGASFTGQVASFSDANPTAPVSDFTATIFWGDGTSSLGVVSQPAGVGTPFVVAGTHTYPEDTTGHPAYAVQAVITDVDGSMTNTSLAPTAVTVNDAPLIASPGLTIGGVEGQPLVNVPVAVFTDTNPFGQVSDFTASINWGDGTVTTGVIQMIGGTSAGPLFEVLGSHVYTNTGPDTVTVTITDKGGAPPIVITSTVSVTQAPIAVTAFPVVGTEGNALTPSPTTNNPGGLVLVGSFTDYGGVDPASSYTVVVNWGDGTTADNTLGLVKVVADGAGTYEVYAPAHVYQEEGNYSITLQVTDTDTGPITVNAVGIATISDATLSPGTAVSLTSNTGVKLSNVVVANFTDANLNAPVSDFTAIIDWGDGSPTSLGTIGGSAGAYTVSGSHQYAMPGAYATKVVVTDDGGSVVTLPGAAVVTDASATGSVRNFGGVEGQNTGTIVLGTFTDPNPLATVASVTAILPANGWGDGTPGGPVTLAVQQIGGGPGGSIFEVLGSHSYAEEGSFTVNITVTTSGGVVTNLTPGIATIVDAALTAGSSVSVQGTEGLGLSQTGNTTFGSVVIGSFTDANQGATLSDFTTAPGSIVVNWGDGSALQTLPASDLSASGSPNSIVYTITAGHVYKEEGTYQILSTVTDAGGATTLLHGQAAIADAALAQAPIQPAVNVNENTTFTLPVASFLDANPTAPVSDFKATIDWGDGTPNSIGTISQPGGVGTPFVVTGTHSYLDSLVDVPQIGHFPITVHVTDAGGSIVTLTNTANVSDPPDFLTGYFNPSSATGILPAANVTKINQPNFLGTTAPFDHVNLFAVPHNGGPVIWLGETEAASNGAWSLSSVLPMPDGVYTVAATLKDQFGHVEGIQGPNPGMPLIITQNLTVDMTGPKVTNVFFDRLHGQIDVTYTDNLSGLVDSTLVDAANYSFSKVHIAKQKGGLYLFNSAMIAPGGNSTTETVVLTLGKGYAIRGGYYNFVIHSASSILPSGVQDVAGNALDGEFYGFFPSGNNVPGGDFVARLDAKHNVIFPPRTEVGHSTPNVPPGTLPGSVYIPTQVPGKTGTTLAWGHPSKTTHKLAITPAAKPTAHDVALAQVAVPKAKKKG